MTCLITFTIAGPLFPQQGWTPISPEQAEYNFLMDECQKIKDYHYSLGNGNEALSSILPRVEGALFQYLKKVSTPISFKVLKDKIAAGEISASYLSQI